MTKARGAAIALLGLATSALAADALATWKIEPREAQEAVFLLLQAGDLEVIPGSPLLRGLPRPARGAVALAAGAAVKAWTRSDDFKARYAASRAEQIPQPPRPPRTRAQLLKEARAEVAEQRADLEAALKAVTPDQKLEADQTRSQAEAVFKSRLALAESPDAETREKERYQEELETWNEANARFPADPKARLKALLEAFVEQTADVDFAAALNPDRTFQQERFEEKKPAWKAAYRAGPEATRAARAFALQWLKELR